MPRKRDLGAAAVLRYFETAPLEGANVVLDIATALVRKRQPPATKPVASGAGKKPQPPLAAAAGKKASPSVQQARPAGVQPALAPLSGEEAPQPS